MADDDVHPYSFGGYGEIGDAEAETLSDREEALRFPCRYVVPDSMRSRIARKSADRDAAWRCGAGVGERCRFPGTDRLLTRQAAHHIRLVDAGRA